MPAHINIKKTQPDDWKSKIKNKTKTIATVATVYIEQTKRHYNYCSYACHDPNLYFRI